MIRRILGLSAAGVLGLSLVACSGAGNTPAPTETTGATEPTATAVTDITVATISPIALLNSTFWIAESEGYAEENNVSFDVVTAKDPIAAVAGGSAQIGVANTGAAMMAIENGLDIQIVGGYLCRSIFEFAVAPEIQSPADLNGRDVAVAGVQGDPAGTQRMYVLKEAGWDLEENGANVVYPGQGSSSWVEFFVNGQTVMTPYFGYEIGKILAAGGVPKIHEIRPWPNFVQVAKKDWIENNQGALEGALRSEMQAVAYRQAPGLGEEPLNNAAMLDLYDTMGEDTTGMRQAQGPFALSPEFYCENMHFGQEGWDATIKSAGVPIQKTTMEQATNLTALEAAQKSLDLDNSAPGADVTNWPWSPPRG